MSPYQFIFEDGCQGALLIAQERSHQLADEGFDADHDDGHQDRELLRAAVAYVMAGGMGETPFRVFGMGAAAVWPWPDDFKPSDDPIRNLVKAGALIAAEIDRLARAKEEAERTRPVTVRRDDLQKVIDFVRATLSSGREGLSTDRNRPTLTEAIRRLQDANADVLAAERLGAAGSSREPGRTGPGSQIHI